MSQEKLLEYFLNIELSGRTLLTLVNDLLDLAKIEAGKMPFEFKHANIHTIADQIIDEFTSLVSERHLTIQWKRSSPDLHVMLDPDRIKQVIRNLLSNAVKFSPKGGVIEFDIICNDDSVLFSVKDQGAGIPEQELATVFDKFVQSSKTAFYFDSSGTLCIKAM